MRLVLVALLLTAATSACGASYPTCLGAVRYGGQTYRDIGFTDHKGTMLKQRAGFVTCDAVNRYGVPAALRRGTESVRVRALPGYPTGQVIEVQVTRKAYSVLVSESAPEQLGRQIQEAGVLNAGQG